MKLYGYFRSSAAFRVRIALNLKGLDYESLSIHLRRHEQSRADYLGVNPQGLVPALVEEGGRTLIQSLAIIEYLDETRPEPPLLPKDPAGRARARALADIVACDIHPINNLRVLRYLTHSLDCDEGDIGTWYNHWIDAGFRAFERLLDDPATGVFCHGDAPGLADIALVPQVVNAERYRLDLGPYPKIARIHEHCMALPAFAAAHPGRQPDREA
jgi:maleylacetoacetate isomerase